ncbi:MAG: GH3 auxin-responsive promoter family protein [Cyanobacteria bacterium CRU_2_1]|nr:GH3 auxin-responsive promoter family protein [Cyanobacteria bacterium RU_5_0]NJR60394.1 GH3 auxin-responsive promoter family protein [Cyanobacteria bacterium CRU_2_1]
MANLLLSAIGAYAKYAKASFIRKTLQPIETQEKYLRKLLGVQQNTELGRSFGLKDIKTIDQFRQQVPIWSYSDYEPYTQRVAQGEPNVLNPDPVVYINLTSGTTGKQKMVPVTWRFHHSLSNANAPSFGFLLDALKMHSVRRSQPLEFGRILSTNVARIQGYTSGGIEYGPVTVGSLRRSRSLGQCGFAQPFEVLEIADSVSRHYVALLFGLCNPNVRSMMANFPMLLLQTCKYLEKYAEDLIWDIEQGTIANWLPLEPEIRTKLERQWVASPGRAAELREIVRSQGRLTPKLAWSKLSLLATARGGTSDFYFERFPEYFGDTPSFGGVFGTAEGTFGIYYDLNQDGSILALESSFYEFVPRDQWDVEQPKTVLPTEVKVGEYYRILVTNYSGFYRYDIGDVVEVVGFYEQTPIIVFRHRRGGLLSSTTEKTTEFHVSQAMQMLQQEFNLMLEDFCITLSENEFPAHYWVNIELAPGQIINHPEAFLARFDYWLGEFNHPYATVRSDQVPPPCLRILAPGSFAIVRQRQLLRGTSDSQLKIPHVTENRRFLDNLQVLQEFRLPADLVGLRVEG